MIHVHVEGRRNGKPAVDYSINAEVGVPLMTGPAEAAVPVNHVLPAWDLITGMLAASAVTAALFQRERTGRGRRVDVALADVALAGVASMGWLAEADELRRPRPRVGNHMFGSFGVDFATSDGRRIMVVALTEGQWNALRRVTKTEHVFAALEETLDADLDLEGDRYRLRETIASVLRPWFAARDFATLEMVLDDAKVLWSPYRDMAEVAAAARSGRPDDRRGDRPARRRTDAGRAGPWRWDERPPLGVSRAGHVCGHRPGPERASWVSPTPRSAACGRAASSECRDHRGRASCKVLCTSGSRESSCGSSRTPSAGPGEVIVATKASGLCGSDLNYYRAEAHRRVGSSCIAGHEPAGVVATPSVQAVSPAQAKIGDRVMIHHYIGCGNCTQCRSGWSQMCHGPAGRRTWQR